MNQEIKQIIQDLKDHIELMADKKKNEWINKILILEKHLNNNETNRKSNN